MLPKRVAVVGRQRRATTERQRELRTHGVPRIKFNKKKKTRVPGTALPMFGFVGYVGSYWVFIGNGVTRENFCHWYVPFCVGDK